MTAKTLPKDSLARLSVFETMLCLGATNLPESYRLGGTCFPAYGSLSQIVLIFANISVVKLFIKLKLVGELQHAAQEVGCSFAQKEMNGDIHRIIISVLMINFLLSIILLNVNYVL
ncbi:TPA: hypothetical protein DIC40_07360 [Patescibacteria group bacterium]|nr:hypothetical protein [Candidatus Gracilibacteria bacterium]